MEYSEEAKKRIGIARAVADALQYRSNSRHEDWRVFTTKEQKHSNDPCMFEICKVKAKVLPFVGEKILSLRILYTVTVDDEGQVVAVKNPRRPAVTLLTKTLMEFLEENHVDTTINNEDWIIRLL